MRRAFPGAHLEPSRNAMATWEYCAKEDTRVEGPLEFGVPPAAKNVAGDTKKRNDLIVKKGIRYAIEEGLVPLEKAPQLQKGIDLYHALNTNLEDIDGDLHQHNEWHWGKTGTGKSKHVRDKYPGAYIKTPNKWWDHYAGQDVVIMEDLGPNMVNAVHLKCWADRYSFACEGKGYQMTIRPKKMIITSNYEIPEIYTEEQNYAPLQRRFQVHHHN